MKNFNWSENYYLLFFTFSFIKVSVNNVIHIFKMNFILIIIFNYNVKNIKISNHNLQNFDLCVAYYFSYLVYEI